MSGLVTLDIILKARNIAINMFSPKDHKACIFKHNDKIKT